MQLLKSWRAHEFNGDEYVGARYDEKWHDNREERVDEHELLGDDHPVAQRHARRALAVGLETRHDERVAFECEAHERQADDRQLSASAAAELVAS